MVRILKALILGAVAVAPFLPAQAIAGPCAPEGPCAPCPIVITFEGNKPHIGYAQC